MNKLDVNHDKYLSMDFYGSSAYAIANEIEGLIIALSWCDDEFKRDDLEFAIEHANYALFKTVGDDCLV